MSATEQMTLWAVFKNISYVAAFIVSLEWLGFNATSLSLFTSLMIIDVFTGIIRACVVEGCQSVRSSIGIHGVLSKILLLSGLFSIAIAGRAVGFDMQMLVQSSVNVLVLGELYSIIGNIHSARTGQKKAEFDAVAYLLKKIKDIIRNVAK